MTNLGDVVRQVEKTLCDPETPPTTEQREALQLILTLVYTGAVDARGSR